MRRVVRALSSLLLLVGVVSVVMGGVEVATAAPAGAANGYGPGKGPQRSTLHWGGAYVLQGVPGYGYCIEPGDADPVELPWAQWYPVAYPGSPVFTNGQMAALAYFASRYEGTGFDGYAVNTTVAAIAQDVYGSAGGTTPGVSQAPAWLSLDIDQWAITFAGPWTISLSMNPASGSTFDTGNNYSGTVTVRSATGAGVGGLQLTAPPTGGAASGQISNFVWQQPTTDSAGTIPFQWNIGSIPPGGAFSAGGIGVVGGSPGISPPTYGTPGGQMMMVSGAVTGLQTGFAGTVQVKPQPIGTISIKKVVPDPSYYNAGGAVFQIRNGAGAVVDTLTTDASGTTPPSIELPTSSSGADYDIHEVVAPPGYGLAADKVITVYPYQNSIADFSGGTEEPVSPAALGAGKTDAQTGRPLAGAVFAFRFDSANNGAYDGDLGECTTGPTGICQPPVRNTSGGWLPGWYQVTEVQAPPGYWLDPTTSVQHVFLRPGADVAASVSFADDLLGSLQLEKTGNDAKYWPVSGAVFSVAGPAPSQATVGTLDVGNGGTTNTITGLVPGTYHVAETTAPPGYGPVPPFSVMVPAGHATTEASVTDPIRTGSITVTKTDAATGAPLAGATFDTWFDSQDDGSFDVDLGTCTTDGSGTCAPRPNDGTSYLPGRYRVTEVSAPAGYALPVPPPSQTVVVDPSGSADFTFTDHRLVPAAFTKVATGNFNPTELVLSGAVLDITTGSTYGGPVVATCTTSTSGRCTTAATLVSGGAYCWLETVAPPGLNSGASGCFTASNTQRTQPLTVTDPGTFVAVAARKVDSANPSTSLPGAVLDLYRVDGGHDASPPTPPAGAADEPGQTWVSRASTESDGVAQFPLQLPGYAYCVVEEQAPADYVADSAEHCTPVLTGSPHVPPPVVTLTVPDTEARVTVSAHKYNSATPGTGIPGAVYDLYVEGQGPPSGPPSAPPQGAVVVPGDRWWTRGTTNADGRLDFSVPAGASWCLKEVSAPVDYTLDSGLHCTERVVTTSPAAALRIALPETTALVTIYTHKFNSARPATTIPGAAYELVGMGSPPAGWSRPANPSDYPVPPGDWYVGTATTGRSGVASWSVPAGRSWCLHEVHAPPGYRVDFAWHCTGIVTTISTPRDETVALPELPLPAVPVPGPRTRAASALLPTLPFTGGPGIGQVVGGVVLALAGGLLLLGTRRRVGGSRAGEATGAVPDPTPHGS